MSKGNKKGVKNSQIEFKMLGICQKIILHPNYDIFRPSPTYLASLNNFLPLLLNNSTSFSILGCDV